MKFASCSYHDVSPTVLFWDYSRLIAMQLTSTYLRQSLNLTSDSIIEETMLCTSTRLVLIVVVTRVNDEPHRMSSPTYIRSQGLGNYGSYNPGIFFRHWLIARVIAVKAKSEAAGRLRRRRTSRDNTIALTNWEHRKTPLMEWHMKGKSRVTDLIPAW